MVSAVRFPRSPPVVQGSEWEGGRYTGHNHTRGMTVKSKDGRAVARDHELHIMRALHRFGWLRTRDLAALVFQRWASSAPACEPSLLPPVATNTGLRMAQRTLRRMRSARLVLDTQAPDGSVIYALSEAGARALQGIGVAASTGKDQVRAFSTTHFRHRCIANEVAISAILEGFRASTEREISRGLWLGGKAGVAGKLPDVLLRSGSILGWVEVERSKKNGAGITATMRLVEAVKGASEQPHLLFGDSVSQVKIIFICTAQYQARLCRDLAASGWDKKEIAKHLKFEKSLYQFKDINFS